MKEQVLRILKMVAEGRLSPSDALDLMDSFLHLEEAERQEGSQEGGADGETADAKSSGSRQSPDWVTRLVDGIEKATKEAAEAVNWSDVAGQIKEAAKKGVESIKGTVDQMSKGGFRFSGFGQRDSVTIELPLAVASDRTLKVQVSQGDVTVEGGHDVGSLTATAWIRAGSKEELETRKASWSAVIEESDGSVSIRQSEHTVSEDYVLRVPRGVKVDIRCESGDISVTGTNADVRASSTSGDVVVVEASGSIEANSASGDIRVEKADPALVDVESKSGSIVLKSVAGTARARSSSGDIRCTGAKAEALTLESVSGDVIVEIIEGPKSAVSLRSVSGDVVLDVPPTADARINLSTVNGSLRCAEDLAEKVSSENRVTGKLGSGTAVIDISSISGDVCFATGTAAAGSPK